MKKLLLLLSSLMLPFNSFGEWEFKINYDDFEETSSFYIFGESVFSNEQDTWAWLYYDCQIDRLILKIKPSSLKNEDYYSADERYVRINTKIDGEIHRGVKVKKDLMGDFLHFGAIDTRIMAKANIVIIQLHHYYEGIRTYTFDMRGLLPLMVNQCSTRYSASIQETSQISENDLREMNENYFSSTAEKVRKEWRYMGAEAHWSCDVHITQSEVGDVLAVNIQNCTIDNSSKAQSFKDSIERAVYKASPLPIAPDKSLFDAEIMFRFRVMN